MIIKCKMCGGDLHPAENATTCECEFCGTVQTLPKLDNERRANLYDRANHFRRNNDYDKAMGIFETILQEDRTDAEAYWSLVLCRYGIEYVEDPTTHKRVPTVNRVQYTSILADEDYKSALEYADAVQRGIYESEAKTIDAIQKGILEISKKEKPFDVFICYKETDAEGKRTPDSVLANDLYHQLTREGFKVFFSRITLEDKLGQQYEPYIFAALNSAKVMVVLGTKPEYFNAVWVKNEWSRYLSLIKAGANKTLVPAYKDMDPYDLPEEFSHLQAQDMSKLGFMQDLIHGIKKLTQSEQPAAPVVQPQQSTGSNGSNLNALLDRAFMALEDGEWAKADDFCEKALNIDARNARAYIGKLLAERKIHRESEMMNQTQPFDKSGNYQKALRFADEKLQEQLKAANAQCYSNQEQQNLARQFNQILQKLDAADSVESVKSVKEELSKLGTYKDIQRGLNACDQKIEKLSQQSYEAANRMMSKGEFASAAKLFRSLGNYRDSKTVAVKCDDLEKQKQAKLAAEQAEQRRIQAERQAKEEAERKEKERVQAELRARQEEIERREAEARAAKVRKICIAMVVVAVLCVSAALLITKVIIPKNDYNKAVQAMENGQYEEAYNGFVALGDYGDCEYRIQQVYANYYFDNGNYSQVGDIYATLPEKYQDHADDLNTVYNDAIALMDAGSYDEAITTLEALGNYADSVNQIDEANYRKAGSLAESGDREGAKTIYTSLDGYSDSTEKYTQIVADEQFESGDYSGAWDTYATLPEDYQTHNADYETMYLAANTELEADNYDEAGTQFAALGSYSDSETMVLECAYQKADSFADGGDYDSAIAIYETLSGYQDSDDLANQATADQLFEAGSYADAYDIYVNLPESYQTHSSDYETMYATATENLESGNYDDAVAQFTSLGNYSDSASMTVESQYQKAGSLAANGDYENAIALYNSLNGYSDSANLATQASADQLYEAGSYAEAYDVYVTLDAAYQTHSGDYETIYATATENLESGNYDDAIEQFTSLGNYSDSASMAVESQYQKAGSLAANGDYENAIALYNSLNGYSDSANLATQASADQLYEAGSYAEAYDVYATLDAAYQTHSADYDAMYSAATELLNAGNYDDAYTQFLALGNYSDAATKAAQCGVEKADSLYSAQKYQEAAEVYTFIGNTDKATECTYLYAGELADQGEYLKAAEQYAAILDYSDSREQHYQMGILARENGNLADAYAILVSDPDYSNAKEEIYQTGVLASANGEYEVSVSAFTHVGAYKDAAMKLTMDTYAWGGQLYESGEYDRSAEVFDSMGEFSDAQTRATEARYGAAVEQQDAGNYEDAKQRFAAISDYSDSATRIQQCDYSMAMELFNAVDYENAKTAFLALGSYSDSADMAKECDYIPAKALHDEGSYSEAMNAFSENGLNGYKDTDTLMNDCNYQLGASAMSTGDYETAANYFDAAGSYSDSTSQAGECRRQIALSSAADYESAGQYEEAYAQYELANETGKMSETAYQAALNKLTASDYQGAIEWFEKAGYDYSDVSNQILTIGEYYYATQQYDLAESTYVKVVGTGVATQRLYELGQYYELQGDEESAIRTYTEAIPYDGAAEKVHEYANAAYNAENYEEAKNLYTKISSYVDVDKEIEECDNAIAAAAFEAKWTVGNYVELGSYPQTSSRTDDTPIEWLVLAREGDTALLISKYALDCQSYNEYWADVTWETCTLRSWLNNDFYNKAFSTEEKGYIIESNVSADKNPNYSTDPGNATKDNIFLLSITEVNKYFSSDSARICYPTDYAENQGSSTYSNGACWWWLRSPGSLSSRASRVDSDGSVLDYGYCVYSTHYGVRPVVWVRLF